MAAARAKAGRTAEQFKHRAAAPHALASLQAPFGDRQDGIDSINRFAEDGEGMSTNSVVVAIPALRTLWTRRGSADRGEWIELRA